MNCTDDLLKFCIHITFCIVSLFLIAWTLTPLYSSQIVLSYCIVIIIILCVFFMYAYTLSTALIMNWTDDLLKSCIHITFCIVSLFLISWTLTPPYSSQIVLFYGNIIVVFFMYAYTLSTALMNWTDDLSQYCMHISVCTFSLIITTIIVTVLVFTVAMFVAYFPTNNVIEQSVIALSTVYEGVLLVGALIAYKVFFTNNGEDNGGGQGGGVG